MNFLLSKIKMFTAALLFIALTACTPQRENMKIKVNTFEKPVTVLIAQVGEFPKPLYLKNGNQGWADSLINRAISDDVHTELEKCEICSAIHNSYYNEFEKTFKTKKVKFIVKKDPISSLNLHKIDDKYLHLAPYDFSSLKSQYKADYAMILEPIHYGLERDYYGFIPISGPITFSAFRLYLVNLKDNTLDGYYNALTKEAVGGWAGHDARDLINSLQKHVNLQLLSGHDYLTKM